MEDKSKQNLEILRCQFLDALFFGDLEKAKSLIRKALSDKSISKETDFLEGDHGKNALLKALAGTNWQCVEYIEKLLGDHNAEEIWKQITPDEANKVVDIIEKSKPKILLKSSFLTYKDLANWYIENQHKGWREIYDKEIENQNIENKNTEGRFIDKACSVRANNIINKTFNGEIAWEAHHYSDHNHSTYLDEGRRRILYPRLEIHIKVVSDILEKLNLLIKKVNKYSSNNQNSADNLTQLGLSCFALFGPIKSPGDQITNNSDSTPSSAKLNN